LFSTADWDHPFWTNKQHVATQLAARGFRVLYVESLGLRRPTARPRDVARMARRVARAVKPTRQVNENLWVASPLTIPYHASRLARQFNERWLAAQLSGACRRLGFSNPIVWTYNPLVAPLASALESSLLVYHCVDDLSAAPGLASGVIRLAEQRLAAAADVVFATSERLYARMAAWNSRATHYQPNVADFDHFSRARRDEPLPAELAAIPRPRIGFVGAISPYKVDFDLIAAVARARPDWHWVLVGQVGEGQAGASTGPLRLANVHLLGPRPYDRLPDYLRGFDVATLPCPPNPYTEAMFPMKFFEYLAAGLSVVAANVPALAEFARAYVAARSPTEFGAAIQRVLDGHRPDLAECDRLARRFTWQWRMQQILDVLEHAWRLRYGLAAGTWTACPRAKAG
jgi:glycosyltransferase involved in cell wall biosynthesis